MPMLPKTNYASAFNLAERRSRLREQVDSGALEPMLVRRFLGEAGLGGSIRGGARQHHLGNRDRRAPFTLPGTRTQRPARLKGEGGRGQ